MIKVFSPKHKELAKKDNKITDKDKQMADKDREISELTLANEKVNTQLMEAVQMVKTSQERELLANHNLKCKTEEVYKLLTFASQHSTPSPSMSAQPRTSSHPTLW
ncbi:hypothetical protein SUGI_0871470 [Cryptomeria japonica]|nr:hypothetical protein SUGI_0871470 [Cryptomeria japonica]